VDVTFNVVVNNGAAFNVPSNITASDHRVCVVKGRTEYRECALRCLGNTHGILEIVRLGACALALHVVVAVSSVTWALLTGDKTVVWTQCQARHKSWSRCRIAEVKQAQYPFNRAAFTAAQYPFFRALHNFLTKRSHTSTSEQQQCSCC
jgi:hypothetical protein